MLAEASAPTVAPDGDGGDAGGMGAAMDIDLPDLNDINTDYVVPVLGAVATGGVAVVIGLLD